MLKFTSAISAVVIASVLACPVIASPAHMPSLLKEKVDELGLVVRAALGEPATVGATITVITLENRARLCAVPDCGQNQELLRVPTGQKLSVIEVKYVLTGGSVKWDVVWYKVAYNGKEGWMSEFNTDKAPAEPRYR